MVIPDLSLGVPMSINTPHVPPCTPEVHTAMHTPYPHMKRGGEKEKQKAKTQSIVLYLLLSLK